MKIFKKDLTTVTEGLIVHQVNCQDKIGAGLSGVLIKKWPKIEEDYHNFCKETPINNRLGRMVTTWISKDPQLAVTSIFGQYNYGNSAKTGITYTDMPILTSRIKQLCNSMPFGINVYIPSHIGCGLAGGDWDYLKNELKDISNLIVCDKDGLNKEAVLETEQKQGVLEFHSMRIPNSELEKFDEVYAIVRSNKGGRFPSWSELSPSRELFSAYINGWKKTGWNKDVFDKEYTPWFINDMTKPEGKQALATLYDKIISGKNICCVCFCPDERMCHRYIVAGIMKGAGLENVKLDNHEPDPKYYELWQTTMKEKKQQRRETLRTEQNQEQERTPEI